MVVINLTSDEIVDILGAALRSHAPEGAVGIAVRFRADELGDNVDVSARVMWLTTQDDHEDPAPDTQPRLRLVPDPVED